MDTNKNSYTVIYATILVVVVAALLAIVSLSLKDKQQINIEVEKQMNILGSAHLAKGAKEAPNKNKYIQDEFTKNITEALIINAEGDVVESFTENIVESEAFKIEPSKQFSLIRQINEGNEALKKDLKLPVFICTTPDGAKSIILSCYGQGLWGDIWGYISLKDDYQTLNGALFDHAGETPGLGAEITSDKFKSQFEGKSIFDNDNISPIKVVKGGVKDAKHEIDAISGATITSTCVQDMISNWLKYYEPYLKKQK